MHTPISCRIDPCFVRPCPGWNRLQPATQQAVGVLLHVPRQRRPPGAARELHHQLRGRLVPREVHHRQVGLKGMGQPGTMAGRKFTGRRWLTHSPCALAQTHVARMFAGNDATKQHTCAGTWFCHSPATPPAAPASGPQPEPQGRRPAACAPPTSTSQRRQWRPRRPGRRRRRCRRNPAPAHN